MSAPGQGRRRRFDVGLAGLGMEMVAAVVGLGALGWWIDRSQDTAPWGLVICATIGFVGGMYNLIRSALAAAREAERRARREEDGE